MMDSLARRSHLPPAINFTLIAIFINWQRLFNIELLSHRRSMGVNLFYNKK
ncbi:hypothetical protein [Myxosarcina sp. GI1]|uniref:hypothetical protein n=1 Tax=Myxosarcina sp. GI1 TaxID=1541065 RepID=UPI0012E04F64|nr:hypothetical protein [Myxosarcina sp. GI1]